MNKSILKGTLLRFVYIDLRGAPVGVQGAASSEGANRRRKGGHRDRHDSARRVSRYPGATAAP